MRNQSGYTLVEMTIVIAILGFMSTLAALAGTSLVTSARLSEAISQVRYGATFSRVEATSKYEQWRIRFIPTGGGTVAQQYVLESCPLAAGSSAGPCTGGWTQQGDSVQFGSIGFLATWTENPGPSQIVHNVTELYFDRSGQFYILGTSGTFVQETVQITACTVTVDSAGNLGCTTNAKTVQLQRFSGAIQYL